MAISTTKPAPGVGTAGTGLVLLVPKGGIKDLAKPTITELDAETAIDITYLIADDGLERDSGQEQIEDNRLTLAQALTIPGVKTDEVSLTFPFGQADSELDETLIEGEEYILVIRSATPKTKALAEKQLVDVIPFTCGRKTKLPPARNSVWRKKVTLHVSGEVYDDVEIATA